VSKYKAKKTSIDGKMFASKKEAARYRELSVLEFSGKIAGLILQPKLKLEVAGVMICTYIADFHYIEQGKVIIEDVKGVETPVFKLKWKLAKVLYPDITFRKT